MLHIPVADVTPGALTSMPCLPQWSDDDPYLSLYLSGVTDQLVEAAGDIVAALTPRNRRLWVLRFPEATLDFKGWDDLFKKLQQAGVRVKGGVEVPDTYISKGEAEQLMALTLTMLDGRLSRLDNERIWR